MLAGLPRRLGRAPISLLRRRARSLFGSGDSGATQSLIALALNSSTSIVAGAFLGSLTGTFERYPGLLVLVPAAIGLRGNVFGTFGNRLGTAIHAGTFRLSARRETVLGQNVAAALILTLFMSLALAGVTKGITTAFGLPGTIPVVELSLISIVGGALASVVVLVATVGLTAGAVRYDWDLDNVTAPLVSTLGDVLTLPALYLATALVGFGAASALGGSALMVAAVGALVVGWWSRLTDLRRIVRESVPVLLLAATVSAMAGIVLEKRFDSFAALPALLVLVPAHLSSAGALGGILSGRLSSKLFLGLVAPRGTPGREARRDIGLVLALGVPVYAFNAVGAEAVARLLGEASPGLGTMLAASLLGGMLAMVLVVALAYYGTVGAYRVGVDPDTWGIPVISSCVDFVGAFTLILSIVVLGLS